MNIVTFIGMSGVGKSSLSKGVAKALGWNQVDTDTILEQAFGQRIPSFIDEHGETSFLKKEEDILLDFTVDSPTIIATGGSVVYSKKLMAHLKSFSHVVYLKDDISNLQKRIKNYENRGIVGLGKKSVQDVYDTRKALYNKYSDSTIQINFPFNFNKEVKKIVGIIEKINQKN